MRDAAFGELPVGCFLLLVVSKTTFYPNMLPKLQRPCRTAHEIEVELPAASTPTRERTASRGWWWTCVSTPLFQKDFAVRTRLLRARPTERVFGLLGRQIPMAKTVHAVVWGSDSAAAQRCVREGIGKSELGM